MSRSIAFLLLSLFGNSVASLDLGSITTVTGDSTIREPGRCSIYGECGKKSSFGNELPCPDNGLARYNNDSTFITTLESVCGSDFISDYTKAGVASCCTLSQLEALSPSLAQAESLLATCPACRNNFRRFYCSFTCSPNQSQFLDVTSTQNLTTRLPNGTTVTKEAVKSIGFYVGEKYGKGFYDSCKDVKFGATNGYAMDLIGGGAKEYKAFLRFMGQERSLGGSPFQIDFPDAPSSTLPAKRPSTPPGHHSNLLLSSALSSSASIDTTTILPFNPPSLNCASPSLSSRCACPDCPSVCTSLPPRLSPRQEEERQCRVGLMGCFSFFLVIGYAIGLIAFILIFGYRESMRGRNKNIERGTGRIKETGSISFSSFSTKWKRMMQNGSRRRDGYDRVSRDADDTSLETQRLDDAAETPHTLPSSASSVPSSFAAPSSPASSLPLHQPRLHPFTNFLSSNFYSLGFYIASHPYLVISISLALCGVVNLGWQSFEVERDPVRLWVAKGSQAEKGKRAFDEAFGETWRSEQVFVWANPPSTSLNLSTTPISNYSSPSIDNPPVLSYPVLQWWEKVEREIKELRSSPNNLTWGDVCFNPSASNPTSPSSTSTSTATDDSTCVIQSFLNYFVDVPISESTWRDRLNDCVTTPASCLGPNGPMNPKLILGAVPSAVDESALQRADLAKAFIVTYVLSSSRTDPAAHLARSIEWEETLQAYLLALSTNTELNSLGISLTFSTGVSLEEELNEESNTDARIVVLSYAVMFLYVALNLGRGGVVSGVFNAAIRAVKNLYLRIQSRRTGVSRAMVVGPTMKRRTFVESKFLLGLVGISIVLLSVSTSVALFSALRIKVTLIIAEVIPFLVLAIGVDNVFILCHELDRQNARAYLTASRNGPLVVGGQAMPGETDASSQDHYDPDLLPSVEERIAATLARMGPSILYSATCETIAFGLGSMVGMPAVKNFAIYAAGAVVINTLLQLTVFVSAMAIDLQRVESNRIDCFPCIQLSSSSELNTLSAEGSVTAFFRTIYAPVLMKKPVKYLVVVVFSGLFVLSWISARHIELGLNQRLALPSDSYLIDYFNALDNYLEVGPPVFFVTAGIDVRNRSSQQLLCGRFSTCDELSLANVLEAERKRPDSSFLAEPPAVWLDDYFQWLNPLLEDCCRVKINDPSVFCTADDSDFICRPCFEDREPAWNITMEGLPTDTEFMRYLRQWLVSPSDESCPLGGKAPYSSALSLSDDGNAVELSHFRTYHTPLKKQSDFIEALAAAERIAADLSTRIGAEVFPYSIFYVFFDQYSHIVATTREVLTLALIAIFLVTTQFLGSWRTATAVTLTVLMSLVNIMGLMNVFGINLNAISLVNLVISCGISVEFCAHIARAFMGAKGGGVAFEHKNGARDRDERAMAALVDVGASVFSGITMTKLLGIFILGFTRSKLLEIYFFRHWCALILSGALHGLVFFPVLLSFQGGQGYAFDSDDEGWIAGSISNRYTEMMDDEEDEDDDDESVEDRRRY